MSAGDRTRALGRWLASRSPRQILYVAWIVFGLGCYPGYLSTDSVLQLYSVRSGEYTDYSPVMSAVWGALEYVSAGPFPMLALQSGLLLFGLYALLARVLVPRVAALAAAGIVLFPPVFAVMAVIWPDPFMAAMLIAGFAAVLEQRRGWRIAGVVMLLIATATRPEVVLALIPLSLVVVGRTITAALWKRTAIALGLVVAITLGARIADHLLTERQTYFWQQQLEVMDTVGTIRRAKLKKVEVLEAAFAGMPFADIKNLKAGLLASGDALNWWSLSNGPKRLFDPVTIEPESRALSADWRAVISKHLRAYTRHRRALATALLGLGSNFSPVYDSFGDPDLMAPLHHRASTSDWQRGWQAIVRAVDKTPLCRPWLYLVLAIVAIVLARRRPIVRALAISGLVYELAMFVLAPLSDYRYSHLLVTLTCTALAAVGLARKWGVESTDA
jgi:hypothetical protein